MKKAQVVSLQFAMAKSANRESSSGTFETALVNLAVRCTFRNYSISIFINFVSLILVTLCNSYVPSHTTVHFTFIPSVVPIVAACITQSSFKIARFFVGCS